MQKVYGTLVTVVVSIDPFFLKLEHFTGNKTVIDESKEPTEKEATFRSWRLAPGAFCRQLGQKFFNLCRGEHFAGNQGAEN